MSSFSQIPDISKEIPFSNNTIQSTESSDSWDDDNWDNIIPLSVPQDNILEKTIPEVETKALGISTTVIEPNDDTVDEPSDEPSGEQSDETSSKSIDSDEKKISAQRILVEQVFELFNKDYMKFKDCPTNLNTGRKSKTYNLSNPAFVIPKYGNLGLSLAKAEVYYSTHGTKKVNISVLRSNIDKTQTELRIAISKNDYVNQEKFCLRLQEQRLLLQNALSSVEDIKNHNTPYDHIRQAISILKNNNSNSLRFCRLFQTFSEHKKFDVHLGNTPVKKVDTEIVIIKTTTTSTSIVQTTIQISETSTQNSTQNSTKSSIFGKKKLF
jgi:hypothetical protein